MTLSSTDTASLEPFSDWLSISFPASASPYNQIIDFFGRIALFKAFPKGKDKMLYCFDAGTLMVKYTDSYHSFSFSGGVLGLIRGTVHALDFMAILRSAPSNITRLDAAIDIPLPGHMVLSSIQAKYPDGVCEIAGHPRNMFHVISNDPIHAGQVTGTTYFQSKGYKGYVGLRVYDKINEMLNNSPELKSVLSTKGLTRYELSVYKGASLDDFARPRDVFWHYLPTDLLKRPQGVEIRPWKPSERISYDSVDTVDVTDYERLRRVLEGSMSLRMFVEQACSTNGGLQLLHRVIDQMSDDEVTL